MTIDHTTTTHDDVLAWPAVTPAVTIASALDGNTVVTSVKQTVFNQHILARLRVATVSVGTLVNHLYATHGDILREQRVHHPEGRIKHRHLFNQHILTVDKVDQLHTQAFAHSKHALLQGHIVLAHLLQDVTVALGLSVHGETAVLRGGLFVISEIGNTCPLPEGCIAAIAVDGSLATDTDVLGTVGVNTRRIVIKVKSLITGIYQGIECRFEGKLHHSTLFHHKIYIILQCNGTCHISTSGHDHLSSTCF